MTYVYLARYSAVLHGEKNGQLDIACLLFFIPMTITGAIKADHFIPLK